MGYADLEKTENGFLVNQEDWSQEIAIEIAASEGIAELTEKHWDVINYLRDEFLDNHGKQPNDRAIVKAMSEAWGEKIKASDLYALFIQQPSKVAGKIGGLPESKRKAGY